MDFAVGAIRQANARAKERAGKRPTFLVADATNLPFASSTFAFVYDRGCFHSIPDPLLPHYFPSVARVIKPGGMLLMFVRTHEEPMRVSPARVLRRIIHRRAPDRLSEERLVALLQDSMEMLGMSRIVVQLSRGKRVEMIVATLRGR